jgi:hypothetical protein
LSADRDSARALCLFVDLAWRWLVGGVVAIVVGLAVWWTAFVLVPAGAVLLVIGVTKSVRGIGHSSVRH